jgi:hypothetical protein
LAELSQAVIKTFITLLGAASLAMPGLQPAYGQTDPTTGVNSFPQYRNLSGLAGGGYGVDVRGYSSPAGPVALSTPVAYVLGRSQFRIGIARASFTSEPSFFKKANGTGILTYGHTLGRVNVAVTGMMLSDRHDQSFHLQLQYISSPDSRWAGSIGVQDWGGGGGSSGTDFPGDERSSRSVFGVATYRWDCGTTPIYLSGGVGTRRFGQGFLGASAQVAQPLRLWIEHDGFGLNAGGLVTLRSGRGRGSLEYNLLYGMIKLKYAVGSLVIGF